MSNILKFTAMKKILAILVACAFIVSCQWWHETFSSPEDCVKWYAEQVEEAVNDGDQERVTLCLYSFQKRSYVSPPLLMMCLVCSVMSDLKGSRSNLFPPRRNSLVVWYSRLMEKVL